MALVATVPSPAAAGPQERFHPARDVSIRRISGSVFLHTSRAGELSTNGLIVGAREGTLLVNTAPTAAQTEALLRWVTETLPRPVRLAILTAPDAARMGGLQALVDARIPIHASWRTERRARERQLGWTPDHFGFESEAHISAGDHTLHLFQPEELPPDILAVWVPEEGVLYAGELILPADPGGVPLERDLALARARALSRVRGRFPDPVWVVPATGEPGDRGLVERALRDLRRLR